MNDFYVAIVRWQKASVGSSWCADWMRILIVLKFNIKSLIQWVFNYHTIPYLNGAFRFPVQFARKVGGLSIICLCHPNSKLFCLLYENWVKLLSKILIETKYFFWIHSAVRIPSTFQIRISCHFSRRSPIHIRLLSYVYN